MAKFPDVTTILDDHDGEVLMDHLQKMYIDTHNILFMAAILALFEEYGLPFDDYLLLLLSRHHMTGILNTDCEGRNLQKAVGLLKPALKRKQFEDLWKPESPRIALWYPERMISLVKDTKQARGVSIDEAFRVVAGMLDYSESSVKARYYRAIDDLDFNRRIDSPDFNKSYNAEFWDHSIEDELFFPISRTN